MATTTATSSTATSDASSDSAGSSTSSSSGSETTGPDVDTCADLCANYDGCDESVRLTCEANCDQNVPYLLAYDEACGEAADAYFTCRFTQTCDDAIEQQGLEEPTVCTDELDLYVTTCLAMVPPACNGYCDTLIECTPEATEADDRDPCNFECVLLHGAAEATGTTECDDALQTMLTCFDTTCNNLESGACDEASNTFSSACIVE